MVLKIRRFYYLIKNIVSKVPTNLNSVPFCRRIIYIYRDTLVKSIKMLTLLSRVWNTEKNVRFKTRFEIMTLLYPHLKDALSTKLQRESKEAWLLRSQKCNLFNMP